ncbi:Rv3654c family TadE-like protein [Pseudarthrobacter sp. J1738]|uniref:Rv3654c family TadE-like protein n=1 Tax=unclassified Pseudarthrobacter TaxID=2647000 RepID=UPI003D29BD1D
MNPKDWPREERGAGTVLSVTLCLVLLLLLGGILMFSQAASSAVRAAKAADLAALAAADVARGLASGEPCEVAREVVDKQRATLASCEVLGPEADMVIVTATVHIVLGLGDATGRSKAGPPP